MRRRGTGLLEFTFSSIPLIFVLISIAEMGRAMWTYHTLAHAVKEGARFAAVHGEACAASPNSCTVTLAQVADRVRQSGVGLLPERLELTFRAGGVSTTCTMSACLGNQSRWPAAPADARGSDLEISAGYAFQSAMCLFWPGTGSGTLFGTYNFSAASREKIQF